MTASQKAVQKIKREGVMFNTATMTCYDIYYNLVSGFWIKIL